MLSTGEYATAVPGEYETATQALVKPAMFGGGQWVVQLDVASDPYAQAVQEHMQAAARRSVLKVQSPYFSVCAQELPEANLLYGTAIAGVSTSPYILVTKASEMSVTPQRRSWLDAAALVLWQLSRLRANWDREGGPSIGVAALRTASNVLSTAVELGLPHPNIGPVIGGGLQIEWSTEERLLEIEILIDGRMLFFRESDGGQAEEGSILGFQGVQSHLRWLERIL